MSARVTLLAAGSFAVGTSAYVVTGVLPTVSAELGVSPAVAGQLVTVFALSYAVGAPVLAAATARWERRRLLVAALGAAALGNALAALAPTFGLLLGARVVSALGAAVFTPAATLVATELSPPERRGRAVAIVFGGLTFALVLGVPAGNLLGGPLGYRGVFALVALAAAAAALTLRLVLPTVAAPAPVGLRERFAVAGDRRVLIVLGTTVLGVVSAMTVFTYASPLLESATGAHGVIVGILLLTYGLGAVVGNGAGGRLADRFGTRGPMLGVLAVVTLLTALLPLTLRTLPGAALSLLLLGAVTWAFNPPLQSRLIELAPGGSGLLLSLNASAIYFGAGLAGLVGGVVVAGVGVLAVPVVAAAVGLGALGLQLLPSRRPVAPAPEPVRVASDV